MVVIAAALLFLYLWIEHASPHAGTWSQQMHIDPSMLGSDGMRHKTRIAPGESKGELECRRVMENLFRVPFPKITPDFLCNNVTGRNLELDCYNAQLKIAVEYNGRQHYEFVKSMHKNYEAFLNQKYRDLMKQQLCRAAGVRLIIVPYTVKIPDIPEFIYNALQDL